MTLSPPDYVEVIVDTESFAHERVQGTARVAPIGLAGERSQGLLAQPAAGPLVTEFVVPSAAAHALALADAQRDGPGAGDDGDAVRTVQSRGPGGLDVVD